MCISNGRIIAVPYNSAQILEIGERDKRTRTFSSLRSGSYRMGLGGPASREQKLTLEASLVCSYSLPRLVIPPPSIL